MRDYIRGEGSVGDRVEMVKGWGLRMSGEWEEKMNMECD